VATLAHRRARRYGAQPSPFQDMRSGGRVVEGARLESEYTPKAYRGFESLPLRQLPSSWGSLNPSKSAKKLEKSAVFRSAAFHTIRLYLARSVGKSVGKGEGERSWENSLRSKFAR
jgi:hypothetical protein